MNCVSLPSRSMQSIHLSLIYNSHYKSVIQFFCTIHKSIMYHLYTAKRIYFLIIFLYIVFILIFLD